MPGTAWPGRRSAELVQLLALAHHHRLTREQVIEALWPHLDPGAGAANLRKAAHHARQGLGCQDAVVLRGGMVMLFPACRVETDVECFEQAARQAQRTRDRTVCAEALRAYPGTLLPGSLYEECVAGLAATPAFTGRQVELARAAALLRSAEQGELGRPTLMFLTKEAARLAVEGVATGTACEGCPPLADLADRYASAGGRHLVCPICFEARKLDKSQLIKAAELGGTVPMWQWIGNEGATTFSY